MTASWRESLLLGVISFLFTYLFSIINNTWQMSMLRAGIGFLLFFLLGYIFQFLFHQMVSAKSISLPAEEMYEEENEQIDHQNRTDFDQNEEPLFQEITLGSLHNGDTNH